MNFVENKHERMILWFDQISYDDGEFVGAKNASIGGLYNFAIPLGIRVPNGFTLTARACRMFLHETGLAERVRALLGTDKENDADVYERGKRVREACMSTLFPAAVEAEIRQAYRDLSHAYHGEEICSEVFSSRVIGADEGESRGAEGDVVRVVVGADALLVALREVIAAQLSLLVIASRTWVEGDDLLSGGISAGIRKMVRADRACSGRVAFGEGVGSRDFIEVMSVWGAGGEAIQKDAEPDRFLAWRPGIEKGYHSIIKKTCGEKRLKAVSPRGSIQEKKVTVSLKERKRFTLTDDEATTLVFWGAQIEKHSLERGDRGASVEILWAKDGATGELFVLYARAGTLQEEYPKQDSAQFTIYTPVSGGEVLAKGVSVGNKIAVGTARVILSPRKLASFKEGDILITEATDPDWEPIIKKASGIVVEHGGRTSHTAVVARALGIPAIIGAEGAIAKIKPGIGITMDTTGDTGLVYRGVLPFEKKEYEWSTLPPPQTAVGFIMDNPARAFEYRSLPHRGAGILQEEFIIASHIKIHPLALVHYKTIKDQKLKRTISTLTEGYTDKQDFFVTKLAEGIAMIGAAFAPHPVCVRFSDFTSNEYQSLLGGALFETKEENPAIGWRGATRYGDPRFEAAFRLECSAIKRARDVLGVQTLEALVPFCRTPKEGRRVVEIMRDAGLAQGAGGIRIHMVCETPAHIERLDEYLDIFDGYSIDIDNVAQLVFGVDQNSLYAIRDPREYDASVGALIRRGVEGCKRHGKYVGVFADAFPTGSEILKVLSSQNVDVISVTPEALPRLLKEVFNEESTQKSGAV